MWITGVKHYSCNEDAFHAHMEGFIGHITNVDHTHCLHDENQDVTERLDPVEDAMAVEQLDLLIQGYLDDCKRYLHGYSTIQLESINSTVRKRVDKQHNWTVMYKSLFDVGILECNEGTRPILSLLLTGLTSPFKVKKVQCSLGFTIILECQSLMKRKLGGWGSWSPKRSMMTIMHSLKSKHDGLHWSAQQLQRQVCHSLCVFIITHRIFHRMAKWPGQEGQQGLL